MPRARELSIDRTMAREGPESRDLSLAPASMLNDLVAYLTRFRDGRKPRSEDSPSKRPTIAGR